MAKPKRSPIASTRGFVDHVPLGAAVLAARNAVREKHASSADWADYVLYGNHEFVLKA